MYNLAATSESEQGHWIRVLSAAIFSLSNPLPSKRIPREVTHEASINTEEKRPGHPPVFADTYNFVPYGEDAGPKVSENVDEKQSKEAPPK